MSIRENFAWTLPGTAVYTGSQWGMLVILARLGSPELVGRFALAVAVSSPVILLSQLSLRSVQVTDARRAHRFEDVLRLRLIMTGLAWAAIAAMALGGRYDRQTAGMLLAVGGTKAFESISDVYYGLLQQHERMDRIAQSMMLKGVLSLVVMGAVVYATRSALWGAVGVALVSALLLAVYDVPSRTLVSWIGPSGQSVAVPMEPPRARVLTRLLGLSLPLGVAAMLVSLTSNIPRYFIEHHLGERDLGIFAAVGHVALIGVMVFNVVGQTVSPRLAAYYAAGQRRAYLTLILKLTGAAVLLGVGGIGLAWLAGRPILMSLYGTEYVAYSGILVALMAAAAVQHIASVGGYGMTATHSFRLQPFILAAAAAITLGVAAVLVPTERLMGAAIAWGAGGLFQAAAMFAVNLHALAPATGQRWPRP